MATPRKPAPAPSPDVLTPDVLASAVAPVEWINVRVTEYPGADGAPHRSKPGDPITDAAAGWPPAWVVEAGHVRPALSEEE